MTTNWLGSSFFKQTDILSCGMMLHSFMITKANIEELPQCSGTTLQLHNDFLKIPGSLFNSMNKGFVLF